MRHYGFVIIAWAMAMGIASSAEAAKPNVVIIVSDDQGWGDLASSGNTDLSTPHIDSLGRDGATLDRFYVCPVCSPTRAELLTGRYHLRGGVTGVSTGQERLDLDERTLADAFRAAGYATGCFGKWHNGMQYPYHPRGRGFDTFFGFASGHWGQYVDWEYEHDGVYEKTQGFVTDVFTDRAMAFIEANRDKPFFCYLPLCTPHSPMQVPNEYWERFADKKLAMEYRDTNNHTRAALAMVENIDDNVGRLLAKLESLGIADDTIVIYFSDNGPNGWRWNDGMRGKKGSTDEGGVRSPCFVRYPKRVPAGTRVMPITGAIDVLPTLTELCGIERVGDKPLDGMSIAPLLEGAKAQWPDRMVFSHWNGRVSVRTQRWRLDHAGKLYDMAADPGQTKDVSGEHPGEAARLRTAVTEWRAEMKAEPSDSGAFPVGHADWRFTELPARDAEFAGNIKRSSRHPNCSYLTQWTSVDDRITWDVEVLTAGRYEAVIEYTCAAGDVGATVELAFNGASVRGKITEAHDPPAIGKADDREGRSESYVKDFRPLSLGMIDLRAGAGKMTLRASEAPAERVGELRRLTLTRVAAE